MNQQLTIPLARRSDPPTSHRAAARAPRGWPDLIAAVLHRADMTDNEICEALGVNPKKWPTVKSARSRMVHRLGWVEATGEERAGQTVWRLLDIATVHVRNGAL